MSAQQRRIGIMGGTFDPIHIGHLVTAEAVRVEYQLDEVIFIPAANPPHKNEDSVTKAMHRYIMTAMATYSNPFFHVSAIEMERPGPSYTIDTIYALKKQYGANTDLFFITGADTIQEIPTLDRIEELLGLCHFIAATRQGCKITLEQIKDHFGQLGKEKIHRLNTPELEISSTDIRDKVKNMISIKYLVPESVEKYIYKEKLYLGK